MKTRYSCAELADMKIPGMPASKKGWIDLVSREGWEGHKRAGRGGGFEYTPPAKIANLIAARHHIKSDGHAAAAARAAMAAVKAQTRAEHHAKTQVQVEDLMASLYV